MKKIFIILLFISNGLFSQSNSDVIKGFVKDNIGKKVGHGECFYLIDGAYSVVNPNWKDKSYKGGYYYGKFVKDVKEGDVVLFYRNGEKKPYHIAIVYGLTKDNIIIAEQNTSGSIKNSIVSIRNLPGDYYFELEKTYIEYRRL